MIADWRRDERRVPRECGGCGRETTSQPSDPDVLCLDCIRARHGLNDDLWFVPIGPWHPTVPAIQSGERQIHVWGEGGKPEVPAWPAIDPPPEIVSTAPRPADAPPEPRAVLGLQRAAREAGWPILVGYSRGPVRSVRVGAYKRVEVFGVQAAPHPETRWRFWALYSRPLPAGVWSWRISIWRADRVVFTHATVTDLADFIGVRGSVLPAWFKGIHARVEEQKERQRVAAKARPKKTKEGSS